MLSIIVSLGIGAAAGLILYDLNIGLSANVCMWIGIPVFLISQVLLGLLFRKKVKKLTDDIQKIITEGQVKLNRKIQFFQQKPQGGIKTMQKLLEKDQFALINEALEYTKKLEPYCSWNLLLKKQLNTMRMQFYYQLKDFKKVDQFIPKAFYLDQMSVAMKMARQYANNDEGYAKTFKKKVKKFKNENAVILYALYSWILVEKDQIEEAIKVLLKGKEATKDETLTRNWENLVNGKVERFSNAGLGDQWYALYLEEPNVKPVRQKVVRRQY